MKQNIRIFASDNVYNLQISIIINDLEFKEILSYFMQILTTDGYHVFNYTTCEWMWVQEFPYVFPEDGEIFSKMF